eukprot:298896_1
MTPVSLMNNNNNNNNNNNDSEYKTIKQAASTRGSSTQIPWQEWERKFIVKCNKEYENKEAISLMQKSIQICCKLSEYTKTKRKENEPNAPWRTTIAVYNELGKKKKINKRKLRNDSNQQSTKRRKSLLLLLK